MFKNILIAGGGVLGSQIALQNAVHGKAVTIYDISAEAVATAKKWVASFKDLLVADIKEISDEQAQADIAKITYTSDLASALKGIDLVIEAVPESLDIKKDFWEKASDAADKETVFATNSSTLLPSKIATFVDRPDKFISLHFANIVWSHNTAEIMAQPKTESDLPTQMENFAREIGMVPILVKKEQPGYVLNTLLVPLLSAGMYLWYHDIADADTVDKTWMIATGAPYGPFGIIDMVGLRTVSNILQAGTNPDAQGMAKKLKTEYVDQGKLGTESGEGFYKYPDPTFKQADFLK
ncbi:3-hydroxyacyl-CoA dehydrogenase [Periweissella fabaria]|uniref:3-hydroxybutyryl-CoA dehydrogenase n=1 Tax=Periweissella fabaria TaxID=546157 RepID=A0ABN8BM43_9LACO|nr:3-hydroxyacyl-CoA dehydrogenase [Periweissella fabaria]MCM0597781.1 3-hydroxyacyl-CoA dehydrogenase [Periweissella fabaria]CAH0417230.1 3-hydroxybutyryl-CoA dehydrogenase [Periweissella fabaria]